MKVEDGLHEIRATVAILVLGGMLFGSFLTLLFLWCIR